MVRGEGWAVLVVMFAIFLLAAIGLSLGLASVYDALASANTRGARSTFYAAEAGLERAALDLPRAPEWDPVLSGAATSGFRDGAAGGDRDWPGGGTISLDAWVNLANCGSPEPCSDGSMNAVTEDRRWAENNPRWRLFAWGPLSRLAPGLDPRDEAYLVVLAGDDPTETDGDPLRDGATPDAGRGVLLLRASAFGRGRSSRTIEATVARSAQQPSATGYLAQRGSGLADGGSGSPATLERTEMAVGEGGMVRR